MLRTRVITALALMALLLPSLFWLPQSAWALLMALIVGVAAWEWGGLLRWRATPRLLLGVAATALCAALSLFDPAAMGADGFRPAQTWVRIFYLCAVTFWCLVVPFWLRGRWTPGNLTGVAVGAVVLLPAWLAVVQLRAIGGTLGPWILLAVFGAVWMADIAAYFVGRRFGKHKLAPAISPGKTREGAYGAAAGVLAYGLLLGHFFFASLMPLPLWIVALLVVTAMNIIGDLFESLLKRQAGIKDSSNVLPGHGGVLDRIDSLTSALPVVAAWWLFVLHAAS